MSSKTDSKPAETPSPIGEISQEPSKLEAFLDANQKKLVVVGLVAIVILVSYVVYDGVQEMTRRNEAGTVAAARTVPEYQKVSEDLDGKTAGGSALLLKSQLLWDDQQQQEALDTLNDFISKYPEHPVIGSAYASLGSYQQQLGNLTEAKQALEKAVETKSAASSLALLSLGDLARQAGENDTAKEYYDRIITEYEDSHFQVKGFARERIELIGVSAPTEKAPEPPRPTAVPGSFEPPAGLPDVSPKPSPTLIPNPGEKPVVPPAGGTSDPKPEGDQSTEGTSTDGSSTEGAPANGTPDGNTPADNTPESASSDSGAATEGTSSPAPAVESTDSNSDPGSGSSDPAPETQPESGSSEPGETPPAE